MSVPYKVIQDPSAAEKDGTYAKIAKRFRVDEADLLRANKVEDPTSIPADGQTILLPGDPNEYYDWISVRIEDYGGLFHVYQTHVAQSKAWNRNVRAKKPQKWEDLWDLYGNRLYRDWQLRNSGSRTHAAGGCPEPVWVPRPNKKALEPMPVTKSAPSPAKTNIVWTPIPELECVEQDITYLNYLANRVDELLRDTEKAMRVRMAAKCSAIAVRDLAEICEHQKRPGLGKHGWVTAEVLEDADKLVRCAERAFKETTLADLKRMRPTWLAAHPSAWLPPNSDIAGELDGIYRELRRVMLEKSGTLDRARACLTYVETHDLKKDPRFVDKLSRLVHALAAAMYAYGEAHLGQKEAEELLAMLDSAPETGALKVWPHPISVFDLLLQYLGSSMATMSQLMTTVFGNTIGPPSLSVAAAQTATAWAMPEVANGGKVNIKIFIDRVSRQILKAVKSDHALHTELAKAFNEVDPEALKAHREDFVKHIDGNWQANKMAKVGVGVLQMIGFLLQLYSAANAKAPVTGLDYFGVLVGLGNLSVSFLQATLISIEVTLQIFGQLEKYRTLLAGVGMTLGRISCVLGILSGVYTLLTAKKDQIVLKIGALVGIVGDIILLGALLAATPSPPTMALGLALVTIGVALTLYQAIKDMNAPWPVNQVFLALLWNIEKNEMFEAMKRLDPGVEGVLSRLRDYFSDTANNIAHLARDPMDLDRMRRNGFTEKEISAVFDAQTHGVVMIPGFCTI